MSPPLTTDALSCANCHTAVDALRAARVRLINERFLYFCSNRCAEEYVPSGLDQLDGPPPPVRRVEVVSFDADDDDDDELISVNDADADVDYSEHDTDEDTSSEGIRRSDSPSARASQKLPEPSPRPNPSTAPHNKAKRDSASTSTKPPTTGESVVAPPPAQVARKARLGAAHSSRKPRAATKAQPRRSGQLPSWLSAERLLGSALALGCLTIGLLLAKESQLTTTVRVAILGVANVAFAIYALLIERRETRRYADSSLLLNLANFTLVVACLVRLDEALSAAINYSALFMAAMSTTVLVLRRLFRPVDEWQRTLVRGLGQPASRLADERVVSVDEPALRPGEEIVVHAGETVVADVTVTAGKAEIHPWFLGDAVRHIEAGDFVYAGARLASGQVRATVRWTGIDRHWLRLTADASRRADDNAPIVLLSRKLVRRSTPVVGALALAAVFTTQPQGLFWVLGTLAALGAMLSPAIGRVAAVRVARAVIDALRHGIVMRSAQTLESAGRVSTAVFCARGTLLLGEPDLSNIEASSGLSANRVLELAAGAEQSQQHPIAAALIRAARARGVAPDAVRSPHAEPGLGVTAIASNGESLVVGTRGLLLRERISVARAEARITELEAQGRTVRLVALGGHLVGILALQDGLRPGARAAVQHLLDAGIEPVLLSGDARNSCEALGRTIDIEHIRPEVLPADRGREVERLKSGGAQVAVIGRGPSDELALAAASVSIALPSSGAQNMDYDIELAAAEVQKAALSLRIAHQCRREAARSLALTFGGALGSALGVFALSAPFGFIPLASLGFTMIAVASLPTERASAPTRAKRATRRA